MGGVGYHTQEGDMKLCAHCGGQNRDEAQFCGHCGQPFAASTPIQKGFVERNVERASNPGLSTLLSFLWPGLGQLYNGQVFKGAAFVIIQCVLWPGSFVLSNAITGNLFLGPLLFFSPPTAFWIYGMIDAKRVAEGREDSNISPKVKLVVLSVLGIVLMVLFFSFLAQNPEDSDAARRKLEEMGIPYSEDAFLGEAENGNTVAVKSFLAAGTDPKSNHKRLAQKRTH